MQLRVLVPGCNLPAGLWLPLALIVLPLLALIALQAYQALGRSPQLTRSRELLSHTFEVISTAQTLKTALEEAERGQRGYLLTGEAAYLKPYGAGVRDAPALLAKLGRLTSDDPQQRRRMPLLREQIDIRSRELQRTLDVYEHEGAKAAQQILRTNAGLDTMRAVEALINASIQTEHGLLIRRLALAAEEDRGTTVIAFVSGLLAFALMMVGVVFTVLAFQKARQLEARRRADEQRFAQELSRAQAALAQSQKMEALGQLTGSIAHDFNNLLHVIRNAVEIVQRRLRSDADADRYLQMAKRNADRAAGITSRLLAFSRQQPLEPKPIDVNKLVSGMVDLLRYTLGEDVRMETPLLRSGLWSVSADANQLETAILNLAVNGRDAMSGSGQLTIETQNVVLDESDATAHPDVTPGQYVMIAVSDTGVGMTPEVMARACEPFFTTKEVGRGTGLGLSQVFGFMKQSGGHVRIDSEPGKGTRVKLYLPQHAEPISERQLQNPLPPQAAGETILVVEDDEDIRAFTTEVLGELGYRVEVASDARLALAILEKVSGVDLLLTDVGLPNGVSGRQLAEEARRRWPDVKVLLTTAYNGAAGAHQDRLDARVEMITKPFTQSNLACKVRHVLDAI
jgi:signal transduction histidine kinase